MHACTFIRTDDSIDLGNNYRFIQDAPQTIIYHKTAKYEGTGINIVSPVVLSYKFNDRYIIAKSQEINEMTGNKDGLPIHYWIVDKSTNGASVASMDSVIFYQRLNELNINLSL
jgi:hypothetical protein